MYSPLQILQGVLHGTQSRDVICNMTPTTSASVLRSARARLSSHLRHKSSAPIYLERASLHWISARMYMSPLPLRSSTRTAALESESLLSPRKLTSCIPASRLGNTSGAACFADERKDLSGNFPFVFCFFPRTVWTKRTDRRWAIVFSSLYAETPMIAGSSTPQIRTSAYTSAAPACPWPRQQEALFTARNFQTQNQKRGPLSSAVSWFQDILGDVSLSTRSLS